MLFVCKFVNIDVMKICIVLEIDLIWIGMYGKFLVK